MRFYLIIIFVFAISCTPQKSKLRDSKYNFTVEQLKAQKGDPLTTSENNLNSDYQMYNYDDETFQVSGNRVIAKFRNPLSHERNIQYWRHLLKSIYYKIDLDRKNKSHNSNKVLKCPSKGLTIYFNTKGSVLRIGESMGGKGDK